MFRKPLPTTGTHRLGGQEEKRLRKALAARFALDAEAAEALVPKKSTLELVKCQAPSRMHVYVSDGQPIAYDPTGRGDHAPTVFALWRVPTLLGEPVVVRHPDVAAIVIARGADLMLPGVLRIPTRTPPHERGALFAVALRGNPAPFAIGAAEMSAGDVERSGDGRGKFLSLVNVHGDAMWALAAAHPAAPPLAPNEGFTETGVVSISKGDHRGRDATDRGDEDVESDEDEASGADPEEDSEEEDSEEEGSAAGAAAGAAAGSAASSSASASALSPSEMDALIDASILQALKSGSVAPSSLPMLSSAFWSLHVAPSRPAGSPRPEVRRSTHKKMATLIKAKAALGWIRAKEDPRTREMRITGVDASHAAVVAHARHATAREAEAEAEAEAKKKSAGDEYRVGAGAVAAARKTNDSKPPPLRIAEFLRPPATACEVFASFEDDERSRSVFPFGDDGYDRAKASAVLDAYAERNGLLSGAGDAATVTLDPTLADAVYKGAIKKGQICPTRVSRSALARLWLDRWHPRFVVSRDGVSRTRERRGALPPIRIKSERRGGNRRVTRVWGFETYLIDAEELRETLGRALATACSVAEAAEGGGTKKGGGGGSGGEAPREVVCGGNGVEKAAGVLANHYGVPKALIEASDALKGKGKNK
jgi:translation initiation factor 2D